MDATGRYGMLHRAPGGLTIDENKLTIRVEQPLEGCKLEPFTLLLSKSSKAKTQSVNSKAKTSFLWYRSTHKRVCCFSGCPGRQGFPGFHASTIQSLIMPEDECLFCSTACVTGHWNEHKARLLQYMSQSDAAKQAAKKKAHSEDGLAAAAAAVPYAPSNAHGAIQWEQVCATKLYVPTAEDVGHILRVDCIAQEGGNHLAKATCLTKIVLPVPPAPPDRVLHKTKLENRPPNLSRSIRICSYNILAEIYTNQGVYPYCPRWALSWNFRSRNLIREIRNFNADIFCFQEVQADRFNAFFYPEMRALGYEGLYKKKTRQAMGAEGKVDGCAIFYRTSRVSLREKYVIEFNDAAVTMARNGTIIAKKSGRSPTEKEVTDALERLRKDNVAQVVVFETLDESRQRFCVCNTHIHWDPNFLDVKLWQTHMLIKELEKFNVPQNLPIVLCGDFNSQPDSSVYEFLSTGGLGTNHPDLAHDPCGIVPSTSAFRHDLRLVSSFVSVIGQEPKFTNYTESFKGTIDYIFATCDDVYCSGAYLIPPKESLSKHTHTALPNPQFPSDHLGLCADFHFIQPGGGGVGVGAGDMGVGVGGVGQQQQAIRMNNPQRRRMVNGTQGGNGNSNGTSNTNRRNGRYHR